MRESLWGLIWRDRSWGGICRVDGNDGIRKNRKHLLRFDIEVLSRVGDLDGVWRGVMRRG